MLHRIKTELPPGRTWQDKHCTYNITLRHIAVEKQQVLNMMSVRVLASLLCRIILSFVACLALACFSTLSHNCTIFLRDLLKIKCVFWFSLQLLPETFLIIRRIKRDIVNSHNSPVPVIFVRFQWDLNFFERFSKNPEISNFVIIHPVRAMLFHAERRMDG